MSQISAKVIEDSISLDGARLTTLELVYHRYIHAEFKTHRVLSSDSENECYVIEQSAAFMDDKMLSRNASSSRAIPTHKLIEQVRNNPMMPVHWGANQSGMQAREELSGFSKESAIQNWKNAAIFAADSAEAMLSNGLHKQIANRVLEPFLPIHVIVTATEWDNFFSLRIHHDAQPEINELATKMRAAMDNSTPKLLKTAYDWHLPYVTSEERKSAHDIKTLAKISAARCARVSYLTHDGENPSIEKDLALYERLVGSKPIHASPVEHQAYPLSNKDEWCRNFRGWKQFRSLID